MTVECITVHIIHIEHNFFISLVIYKAYSFLKIKVMLIEVCHGEEHQEEYF